MRTHKETPIARSLDELDKINGKFYRSLSREDRLFVKERISHFNENIQQILISHYQTFDKPYNANSYLREKTETLDALIPEKLIRYFNAGEYELRELSEECAKRCKRFELYNNLQKNRNVTGEKPVNVNGAIKRMQDKYWWLRKLRKVLRRTEEKVQIHLGQVNCRKGKYSSDNTVKNHLTHKRHQRHMLENLYIVNENNESFSLAEISDKNVSNPVNRKNELMTRMAGYEEIAKELNHKALFVTSTCPSRFHSTLASSGDRNAKWDGSTPYEAQQYLNNMWALVRADLNRKDIKIYGFRIAEPQHDGTPHWHMLVFLEQHQSNKFKAVIEHYALREDGDEAGAKKYRCDFKDIDYSRGSATGYIAKYVSKNVNGANLDSDIDGGNAVEAAQRVEAWASCWGIRQFQQLGAGAVTVWRELRRLKALCNESEYFTDIFEAADNGKWAEFVKLMGGVFCKRKDQAIRPLYKEKLDTETGEFKQSYFDGVVSISLRGIKLGEKELITRVHEWRLEKRGTRAA